MKKNLILAMFLIIGMASFTISCSGGKDKKSDNEADINTFDEIINGETPVIVDFYAEWCKPCKIQAPIIEELEAELGDKVKVIKVDVDVESELAEKYGIQSIPTIIIFKGGKSIWKAVGVQDKEKLKTIVLDAQ